VIRLDRRRSVAQISPSPRVVADEGFGSGRRKGSIAERPLQLTLRSATKALPGHTSMSTGNRFCPKRHGGDGPASAGN